MDVRPVRTIAEEHSEFDEITKEEDYRASPSLPSRPYEVLVRGGSGSVEGYFLLSTKTQIYTRSGSIKTTIIPVVHSDLVNGSLITDSTSGSQELQFTEPVFLSHADPGDEGAAMSQDQSAITRQRRQHATSSHTSDSGSLKVSYPVS